MIMEIKKGTISGSCYSCGWKGSLDNNHKLAAYIVKNPPKNQSELFKELNRKQPQINETPIDSNSLSDDDWDTGDDDQKET